jgi:hypothetical protein
MMQVTKDTAGCCWPSEAICAEIPFEVRAAGLVVSMTVGQITC